jgi:predicted PurR-regulated permease PerM
LLAGNISTADLLRIFLLAAGVAVGLVLAWTLAEVLLVVFAAIILATVLRAGADFVERYTPLSGRWALALAVTLLFVVIAGFLYLFGTQLVSEFSQLSSSLPQKIDELGQELGVSNLWKQLSDLPEAAPRNWIVSNIPNLASRTVQTLGSILVIVSSGIYLAINPRIYRDGLVLLFPERSRARAGLALDTAGQALRLWMLGQLATMIMVGVAVGVGLWVIGLPSALALGLIAAILEFIPFFGPIMSAIPALILAFSNNVSTVLWVLALIIVVQQVENNLFVPLIQRRTVDLPPALGITSVVAFGILFGWLGLFFGTPLTVVILVLVKYLYVRGVENEDVSVAGLEQAQAAQLEHEAEARGNHNSR